MDIRKSFEFDKVFDGWSEKDLTVTRSVISFLRNKNIRLEQFEDYVDFIKERNKISGEVSKKAFYLRIKIWNERRKACPLCGEKMNILSINVSKCSQVPDKSIKSTWMCPDEPGCGYQEYNHKPIEHYWFEVAEELKRRYGSKTIKDIVDIDLDLENIGGYSYKSKGCGGKRR